MKRQTTVTIGLLVAVTAFLLNPVIAQSSEQPESSVSQIPPSSRSSREIEVPPEQTFIELSRTKKLSSVRSRPPSRRFRTSSSPPPETQTPTKATPEPQPSTTDVPSEISTTTSQPTVTATTPTTPTEGRPNVTAKQVRFTKTRAAKSGRGQVFTFTFKKPEDNSVKEKQHTQSRIPARFSPVFTSQTSNRPQDSSETNQPDNLTINSGPPGDVPRARQSGRALNLSVTAGQGNQISQSQDAETKNTAPQNIGESSTTDKQVPSLRPKSKTRPHKGPINSLPSEAGIPFTPTQAVHELQPVSEGENSSLPPQRRPLKEGLQRVFPNDAGIPEELPTQSPRDSGDLSLQALKEGQGQPNSPAPPRIRYVKAGSLRFFPNRLYTPEDILPQQARNFAEPTAQPLIEGQEPSPRDNYPEPRRPNSRFRPSRPEPEGVLQDSPVSQQDFRPETIRNDVEPTPQTLTANEEHGPSEREFSQGYQPLKQVPLRLLPVPKNQINSQEIPPELARDFANLQNLLASRDPAQFSLPAQQRPQRPLNPQSLRFLSNTPDFPQGLPPQLRTYFNEPNSRPFIVNDGQEQSPQVSLKQSDRPTKVTTLRVLPNNAENLEEQSRQGQPDFNGPTEPTLRVNPGSLDRLQEFQRNNRPLNERLAIFVPIGSQRLPFQQARDLSDTNQERPIENEEKDSTRQGVLRTNRPLNLGVLRLSPNDPRELPPQSTYYDGQGLIRQESQRPNRPSNEESLRVLPSDPQRTPPQSTRDFVDAKQPTISENEEQGPLRKESLQTNRPPNVGTPRFLLNDPQGLPPQSINYADPNIQSLIENERQALAQLRPNRPQLGSVRFVSNEQVFSGEQSTPPRRDNTNLNFQNTPENDKPERPPRPTADSPINLHRVNSELDMNSLSNSAERFSQLPPTREPLVRSQANQQIATDNPEPNLPTNTARPTDPPTLPPVADSTSARVQPAAPTAIPNPRFSVNPPTNIPRLIIEFPSSSSGNDQSIRLQLNPNSAPANSLTPTNPQPNIPRVPADVPSSSPTSETSNNQHNQRNLPTNGGTAQFNLPQLPSLSATASADSPQTNQQTSNSALATNSQVNVQQQLPSQLPALSAPAGDSRSFQPTQQTPKKPESQANGLQPSVQSSTLPRGDTSLRDQPKSQIFQANLGTTNPNSNVQGITANSPPALFGTPSNNLQANSQLVPSNSQQSINPLSKTLSFLNQLPPPQSPSLRDPASNLQQQSPSSNPAQPLTSLSSNTQPVEQLTSVTRDSLTRPSPNSQILSNVGSSVNSLSNNPVSISQNQLLAVREPPTRLIPISQDVTDTEPALNSSSKSQGQAPESKPSVTDSSLKSNGQVSPVDVRLTINFNSNLPGFPGQLQQPSNPTQAAAVSPNNTQLNAQPSPQGQPSPISPNASALPTRPELSQQFQSVTAAPNNFPAIPSQLPAELLTVASSSHLRSQSDFQVPNNFSPSYNPQFNVPGFSPVTKGTSIRTQPFSQFLNANARSVNSQFNSFGRQFDLRTLQSPTIQEQLARFNQNSQFLPANAPSQVSSQFNIPGRPFEVQTHQPPTQDFSARFQPESQFQSTGPGSFSAQFNNFGSQTPFTQTYSTRPAPQVFTANAGLAVNSLSYSPGPSVELLPPVTGDSSNGFKRSEHSTTNEQPRVSFLVSSPELSADLLPPVVSQSSTSALSSNPQPVQPSSTQLPITPFTPTIFDPSAQFVPANVRRIPEPPIELLPPLDPFFPKFSQNPNVGLPPNPIDIPKPLVPALVPPPRERIAIPIDIPRPAVPALVPPPRERIETPIDIPKPDVPALVPPPRGHTETPIDIPRPDVPALVPPPRPSELAVSARFLPPVPTLFTFKPPDVSQQQQNVRNPESSPLNPNANLQSQQIVQTSTDNPVLILPKSSSRPQGRSNNPLSIEDLSRRVGFLPQNNPAPFSPPVNSPTVPTPTRAQSQTDSVFQITDIRAGRVQPIAQEVLSSNNPTQLRASPQSTFLRAPVSQGLQGPFIPSSGTVSQQSTFDSVFSNGQTKTVGQSPINERLTSNIQTPIKSLLPPVGQGFTLPKAGTPETNPFQSPFTPAFGTSLTSSTEPPVVNILPPKPNTESPAGQTTSPPQSQQTLPQYSQEGFIIFQTPTITVTSQTNRPDSQINVTVVTQGGTGHIKPNTTLTAEPVRPANQTLSPDQPLFASTPSVSSSTPPDLPSSLLPPLDQRTSSTPINNILPPLDTGFVRNNFTSNPFAPPFSQSPFSPISNPFRFSNPSGGASPGTSAACQKLELQHKGHRAPQISGHLILSPGFYPIDDPTPTRCDNRGVIDGKKFNWWQILLNHGGEPSTLSRENESEHAKIPALTNSCVRPFETEGVPVFYNITKTDSRTYYREELAYHRFPESKNTFLESRGLFIWTQAKSSLDSTSYLVLYTRDDSGFWLQVKSVNCQFDRNIQPNLQCQSVPECFCDGREKKCTESVPVLTRNFPVKTFRF